ncbi:MAG: NACHT domain-containing protein [Pseudomonadota bacterium]
MERLYVPLYIGPNYGGAADVGSLKKYTVQEVLTRDGRVVVLGDPGAGKSTLVSHLVLSLITRQKNAVADEMGAMIPAPFILRDFSISKGITFSGLLEQFFNQPFWPSELPRTDFESAAEAGQILFLLDGLDEIGAVDRRQALRRAIIDEGMGKYPQCPWLLTSRIAGHEDVPFDRENSSPIFKDETTPGSQPSGARVETVVSPGVARYFLLPFGDDQIKVFLRKWYSLRFQDETRRKEMVASLLRAMENTPSIKRLAHTPNLLTLMALVQGVYAKLPSGRALLYDKITEAYLESIDQVRGLRETQIPLSKQRLWLAGLGYGMQEDRGEEGSDASEILIPKEVVTAQMRGVLGANHDLEKELSYIARRSGLLIPKKPGFFSFVHLSFQEYFAALNLYERLIGFNGREQALEELRGIPGKSAWRETLVFLFEKLEQHPGASDWLFENLFFEGGEWRTSSPLLLTELMGDLQSGLSRENRVKIAEKLIRSQETSYFSELTDKINSLPEETWNEIFYPTILSFFSNARNEDKVLSSQILVFFQRLNDLTWDKLENELSCQLLAKLPATSLVYLQPLTLASRTFIFTELVRRMPISHWFNSFHEINPIKLFDFNSDVESGNKRELFLWSCVNLSWLRDALSWKIIVSRINNFDQSTLINLGHTAVQAVDQALYMDIYTAFYKALLLQDISANKFLSWVLTLDQAMTHAMGWVRNPTRARAFYQSPKRALYRHMAGDLGFYLNKLKLYLNDDEIFYSEKVVANPGLKALLLIFKGRDNITVSLPTSLPSEFNHILTILDYLIDIILGRREFRGTIPIKTDIDVLFDHQWCSEHLPFLEKSEPSEALELLGLSCGKLPGSPSLDDLDGVGNITEILSILPSQFAVKVDQLEADLKKENN